MRSFVIAACIAVQLIVWGLSLKAQVYPAGYFQSPMDTPLFLSATYGSPRENHFHSGMDIRTYEKEGLPIYAIADGYVSRVKIQAVGYGKAIYIDHPNGYTSVYGHLQRYEGQIAAYIRQYQYDNQSFEIDHFPGREKLKVKKGQLIGWSGNSGTSSGPHLHFEIRDTKSEEPINPQLFGIYAVDVQAPALKKILCYSLDANRPRLLSRYVVNPWKLLRNDSSGAWLADTLMLPQGRIGFGADAVDYLVDNKSEYTVYGMDMGIDDKLYYKFRLDRFAFDDTRCVNVHIDYELYKSEGVRYQKLFIDDGNRIPLYPYQRSKGRFMLRDTLVHTGVITLHDVAGHSSSLRFYFRYKPLLTETPATIPCNNATFYPTRNNVFETSIVRIEAAAKTLYDTLSFCYEVLPREKEAYSLTHRVHNPLTPLSKNISVSIKTDVALDEKAQQKLLLLSPGKNGPRAAGGNYENGWVTLRTTQLGDYYVGIDTIPPVIKALNTKKGEVHDTTALRIQVSDNLSGIGAYKGSINGSWVLFEYDAKSDQLLYYFDSSTPKNIELDLLVTDKKNNSSTFKASITLPWRN